MIALFLEYIKYGEMPKNHSYPYAYDATNLLLQAIEAVTVQGSDGTLYIGRAALRDTLYATTDFNGMTGLLNCTEFGDCSAIRIVVYHLDDPSAGLDGLQSNIVFTYAPLKELK